MSEFIGGLFVGLFVGCCVALLIMGLLSTAREDDGDGNNRSDM